MRAMLQGPSEPGTEKGPASASPDPDDSNPAAVPRFVGGVVGHTLRAIFRAFLAVVGAILIAVSVPVAILTPIIPVGLPLAIVGVVLLGRNSDFGRRWMEGYMQRYPKVERFAPNWLMRLVFGRDKREMIEEAQIEAAAEALEETTAPKDDQDTSSR
jgi:hypothetical protein